MKILLSLIISIFLVSPSFAKNGLLQQKLTEQQKGCLKNERQKCASDFFNKKQVDCLEECQTKAGKLKNKKLRCAKKCNLPKLDEEERKKLKQCKRSIFKKCSIKKRKNNFSPEKKKCLRIKNKECIEQLNFFSDKQKLCIIDCRKNSKKNDRKNTKIMCKEQCNLPNITDKQRRSEMQCRKRSHKLCNIINK